MDRSPDLQTLSEARAPYATVTSEITPELLHDLLQYNPLTGEVTWKVGRRGIRAGSRAGSLQTAGYWQVCIEGRKYLVHRIIWMMMTGSWPEQLVDHKNGIRTDNRWSNLRASTPSLNQQNRTKAGGRAGLMGVTTISEKKFRATISVRGRDIHLGMFDTKEEAHSAYLAAKQIYHPHAHIIQ